MKTLEELDSKAHEEPFVKGMTLEQYLSQTTYEGQSDDAETG